MAISDDESFPTNQQAARIYDNPLHSGNEKRLDENEARMAISESSEDNQSEMENHPIVEDDNETGMTTPNIDTPGVVSSINSSEVLHQASNMVQEQQQQQQQQEEEDEEELAFNTTTGNETVVMIDDSIDEEEPHSQSLFAQSQELVTPFEPFPAIYQEDSDPEANMQAVGLHWMNGASEADDLVDDIEYGSQEPMVIPDSSQEDDDDVVEVLSTQSSENQPEPEPLPSDDDDDDEVICLDSD